MVSPGSALLVSVCECFTGRKAGSVAGFAFEIVAGVNAAFLADTGCWELVVNSFLVQRQIFTPTANFALPNYQKNQIASELPPQLLRLLRFVESCCS